MQRADVQDYVDRLRGKGLAASTIANKLDPIRVIFRRAIKRGEISIDPTKELELPAVRGRRERIADRAEASALIVTLPGEERAFWATAIYAGLRRGELRALRWNDVELGAEPALIHVRRTWDDVEAEVEVKTDAGFRVVPLTVRLRELLLESPRRYGPKRKRSGVRPHGGRSVRPLDRSQPRAACVGLEGDPEHRIRHPSKRSGSRRARTRSSRSLRTRAGTRPPVT